MNSAEEQSARRQRRVAVIALFVAYGTFLISLSSDDNTPSNSFTKGGRNGVSAAWCQRNPQQPSSSDHSNCVDLLTPHVGEEWRVVTVSLSCAATRAMVGEYGEVKVSAVSDAVAGLASLVGRIPRADVLLLQASWCRSGASASLSEAAVAVKCLSVYEYFKRRSLWNQIKFTIATAAAQETAGPNNNTRPYLLQCLGDYESLLQLPPERRQRGFDLYAQSAARSADEGPMMFASEDDQRLLQRVHSASARFSESMSLAVVSRPSDSSLHGQHHHGSGSNVATFRGAIVPLSRFLDIFLTPEVSAAVWGLCNGSSLALQEHVVSTFDRCCGVALDHPMPHVSNVIFNADDFLVLPLPLHDGSTMRRLRTALFSPASRRSSPTNKETTTMSHEEEDRQLQSLLYDMSTKNLAPTLVLSPCVEQTDHANLNTDNPDDARWNPEGKELAWWAVPFENTLGGVRPDVGRRTLLACIPGAFGASGPVDGLMRVLSNDDFKVQSFAVHPSSLDAQLTWQSF